MDSSTDVVRMLDDMIEGFDVLYKEFKALNVEKEALQDQLDGLCKKYPSTPTTTENGRDSSRDPRQRKARMIKAEDTAVIKAREIMQKRLEKRSKPNKIQLPDGHPQVEMEHDFTTPGGSQGRLGCPFATMMAEKESTGLKTGRKGRRPGQPSVTISSSVRDPIAAEFHSSSGNGKSQVASGEDGIPTCPIRFLDQHKPEEVAQYFENHKHEIPRSHEVCIKRYQSNESSIRQLDAKYGSLVNMIQGLGQKHKPMLSDKIEEEEGEGDHMLDDKDIAKIERWAGDVDQTPVVDQPLAERLAMTEEAEEERKPRFERDLREVRLGESPSRPWGIQVPLGAMQKGHTEEEAEKAKPAAPTASKTTGPTFSNSKGLTSGSMVFNGPVFFGYSPEDMARLLQQVPALRDAVNR